jgi:hypothetical protein
MVAAMLSITACNYTDGPCYRRGEGDVGAGVGGGVLVPGGVGGYGDTLPDPRGAPLCNAPSEKSEPEDPPPASPAPSGGEAGDFGTDLGTYIRCRGIDDPWKCAELCFDIGATRCVGLMTHPYGSMGGIGKLKQCQSNLLNSTCTYCFDNGDVCTFLHTPLTPLGTPFCGYTGGKGCD